MNTRDYKIFKSDCFYHIYNRGNNKQDIFLEDNDYQKFVSTLQVILNLIPANKQTNSYIVPFQPASFGVVCYCLMPNHFHLLIKQNLDIKLNKLVLKLCTSYAKYFNKKYQRIGNLFQDTFKAKLVDSDAYLMYLSAYIHRNPDNFLNYKYSSLLDYLGQRNQQLCDQTFLLSLFKNDRKAYRSFVLNHSPNPKEDTLPFGRVSSLAG